MLREQRRLLLLENGNLRLAFPVAVGMPGWETPTGSFKVLEKIDRPVWVHPVTGERVVQQGPDNPLGSHWIAFHRDCLGRDAHDGDTWITIKAASPPVSTERRIAGPSGERSPMAVSVSTTRM